MATKSILKNIVVKKRSVEKLVSALENAQGKTSKPVIIRKKVSDATGSDILKMFGSKDDGV